MFRFLTAGLFKTTPDGAVHFYPHSRKRGFVLTGPQEEQRIVRLLTWWYALFFFVFTAIVVLDQPGSLYIVIGWSALWLAVYYYLVHSAVVDRPRSHEILSRAERRDSVLRAQGFASIAGVALFGLVLLVGAAYMTSRLPILWPVTGFYGLAGGALFVWALLAARRKRTLQRAGV